MVESEQGERKNLSIQKSLVVLLVDDEKMNVKAFTRALRSGSYAVYGVDSPARALEVSDMTNNIAVVISDHDMPGMKGPELLYKIQEKHPCATRILMSGRIEQIERNGCAHQYLGKPFDDISTLRDAVTSGIEAYIKRCDEMSKGK